MENMRFLEAYYTQQLSAVASKLDISETELEDALLALDPTEGKYLGWLLK